MRTAAVALGIALAALASAQNVDNVYDRDTETQFNLKALKVYSTVIGPIVRTSAQYTYDNPAKKLTEASVWFNLPNAATLSGFGYFYRNEYVPGTLMDKNKAWFIYTAITSRNEDPAVLDQMSPSSYHAQIYPLALGYDLRVRLYSVGFLVPEKDAMPLPKPTGTAEVPIDWKLRHAGTKSLITVNSDFKLPKPADAVSAVSQRFKDGRIYVAGTVHTSKSLYPTPTFAGLREPRAIRLSDDTMGFVGWLPRNKKIAVRAGDERFAFVPKPISKGPEAAQLWAQQRLAQDEWQTRKDVLKFSLKYHIPSQVTALLAVPKEEMRLFKKKEAEYQRKQREIARRNRDWSGQRQQNWNSTGGGDPEIRVSFPKAEKVYAVLPDGQILNLREANGFWGTNFEIPANAVEGAYEVKVVAINRDGTRDEKRIRYTVDRTAPDGQVSWKIVGTQLVLEVRSEVDLAEVAAYDTAGSKTVLKEVEPGLYRATFDRKPVSLTLVLKDKASNKRELKCSWQPSR